MKATTRTLLRDSSLAAAISVLLSLYVFWPLRAHFFDPWAAGDMLSTYVAADNWGVIASSPTTQYGFPLGMNLNLVPGADLSQNLFATTINSISGNPYFGVNLLLFLSFPIVAALTVIALRLVKSTGPIAIMFALAFTFIPYHWGRGLGHMYLATLYSVVTGVILVLLVSTGRFTTMIEQRKKLQLAGVATLATVTAWSGLYYAVFTLLLMAAALLWRFAKGDTWKQLAQNLIPPAAISALVVIGFLPGLLATRSDPPFAVLAERMPYESVIFAGIFIASLLPAPVLPESIFGFYNTQIIDAINAAPAFENRVPTNFGTLVTSAAFVLLVVGLLMRSRIRSWKATTTQLPLVTYLLGVSFLFFIPWGLNYLVAGTITAQIRAWNRFLPVILLLIILAGAIVLTRVKKKPTLIAITSLGIVATFANAVYPFQDPYTISAGQALRPADSARDYTATINEQIPEYCGVLQLPYMAYPENGAIADLDDYGHFWLPINDSGKAWSYGSIKNTEASAWAAALPEIPTDADIANLTNAGFCGIHLDTKGYVPVAAERIKAEITTRLGTPIAKGNPVLGGEDTWFFFPITDNIQQPQPISSLDQSTQEFFLRPAFTTLAPDSPAMSVAPRGSKDGIKWWWTIAPAATFTLHQVNDNFPVTGITLGLRSSECESAQATISMTNEAGDQMTEPTTVEINPKTTTEVTLNTDPTKTATLTIESSGQGCTVEEFPYPQFVQVINPTTK
jgi:phosphoglycerol transferase